MFLGTESLKLGRGRVLGVLCAACCGLALLAAGNAAAETVTFTTPGCTTWTVPSGSHFQVDATGAAGSAGGSYEFESEQFSGGSGGRGELVSGAPAGISAGAHLYVCVGVGGGGGGGSEGADICETCFLGGAGGGASGVSSGSDFSEPLLVAGGGGGGGGRPPYGLGEDPYGGGAAGQPGAGGGREWPPPYSGYDGYYGGGGSAGSSSEGGSGGQVGVEGTAGGVGSQFTAGGPGAGGAGGYGEDKCEYVCEGGGGGGGGGYYGGGGGGGAGIDGGGGGGGSSLVPAGGSAEPAAPAAAPQVQITYTPGPSTVTEAASAVAQSTATLHASVNPNGEAVSDCEFEYGTTELYGSVAPCEPSPGSGPSPVAVSESLNGLSPKSVYHFRILATSESGTNYGGDEAFETLPDPPAVTGVSPDAGPEAGGTSVTISGAGFTEATAVKFGALSATHFTIDSATSITAIAPAEAPGAVAVTVTNAGGTSAGSAADEFTYVAPGHAPAITSLSAKKGPAAGGSTLTIKGTGFVGVTAVEFGAASATNFTVNSPTSITVETPPATTGAVEVTVTTPNGESAATRKDRFTFGAPTVTNVSPDTGSKAGGTAVRISGSGFALGSATIFELGKTAGASVDCTSTTSCTVRSPATTKAGAVEVIAKVGGKAKSRKSPPADTFTYN
ncbi:MAG: IPT/TIG domain-containing protein [Solirubrobacteraceae bacterium]